MQRVNPLGSIVSVTSKLYCISRLILLLWYIHLKYKHAGVD
ncbi:unnamed protein product [Staurois parvus]|uniref:Uncharacterized protein n=1 Tax=Staurois parvus TaxID=386267 RepID=A0ABN9B5M8_9NEOB|nr:unnamed protein product [Staurois parvus]